jgi:hypothetical protein
MGGNNDYLSRKESCNIHGVRVSTYIICSAIHFVNNKKYPHQPKNIKTGIVVAGRRHHNVFTSMSALGVDHKDYDAVVQGFLTNDDRFVDREEGGRIAYEARQINKLTKRLFSEDLY